LKNNKNFILVNTNLITNFKPTLINNFNNFNSIRIKNQIYCKNFFVYLLLIKYKNNFFKKSNLYIKKYKKNTYTILRSPYRHKLARHQINLNRYVINNSLKISIKQNILLKSWKNILNLLNYIKKINKIFESNIIFINNVKVSIPIKFNYNFLIKNYN
jgi:hypothetical protein